MSEGSSPSPAKRERAGARANARLEYLEWDSEFFGKRIARLKDETLDEPRLGEAQAWCRAEKIDCLYFLADPSDPLTLALAKKSGFLNVDTRVTLGRALSPADAKPLPPSIRPAAPHDVAALRAIARVSHTDGRFYQDPHLDRARCGAFYETWIAKSCAGWAEAVLVAEDAGKAAGYLSCHDKQGKGAIGLMAVGAASQGRGLGRKLVEGSLAWFAGRKLSEASVVTQGRNAGGLKLYQDCGFSIRSKQDWYHYWH